MEYIIAHDIGTSGNKATLFNTDGTMVTSHTVSYETKWYREVWAEQNSWDWLGAVIEATRAVTEGIDSHDIKGISFSGQMMGCLCVDEIGQPLYPSIIWADQRAQEEEAELKHLLDHQDFYRITGHRPSASYSLAKLMWIKNNEPEIYDKTYKVLNAKDFIIYHLTGDFVTDYSDASGTNLLDINTLTWSQEIADRVNIDLDKMPALHASTDIIGGLSKAMADKMGLAEGTFVVCGGGDGVMSAIGAKSVRDGDLFCTLGTSAWNALTTDKPIYDDGMRTFNWVHAVPDKYLPCGTMQAAGASIGWIKDRIKEMNPEQSDSETYKLMNRMASNVEAGSQGIYFLPYLMGERSPRWNPDARACFIGLSMENDLAGMVRAVYEGVAMNMEIILKAMVPADMTDCRSIVMTGGGANSQILTQIFADVYDMKIEIPVIIGEATSIGAAVTAGVGLGIYESFDVIDDFIRPGQIIEPDEGNRKQYEQKKVIFDKLYHSLVSCFKDMVSSKPIRRKNNEN